MGKRVRPHGQDCERAKAKLGPSGYAPSAPATNGATTPSPAVAEALERLQAARRWWRCVQGAGQLDAALDLIAAYLQAGAGCGCKTEEQTGTRNGSMCAWHRGRYLSALSQAGAGPGGERPVPLLRSPEALDQFLTSAAEELTRALPDLQTALDKIQHAQTISRDLLESRVAGPGGERVRAIEECAQLVEGSTEYDTSDSAVNLAIKCGITKALAARIRSLLPAPAPAPTLGPRYAVCDACGSYYPYHVRRDCSGKWVDESPAPATEGRDG